MKDTSIALKAGKGTRMPLTTDVMTFLAQALADLNKAWNEAETIQGFWDELPFPKDNFARDDKYGDRKWVGIGVRGDEFRVTVVNKNGELSVDFRQWWS